MINNNSKVRRLESMVKNLMIRVTALEEFVKIPKEELPEDLDLLESDSE